MSWKVVGEVTVSRVSSPFLAADSLPLTHAPRSRQPHRPHHPHRRSIGEKRGARSLAEHRGERRTIQRREIPVERRLAHLPHAPPRMLHLVLHRAPVALPRVPPVVLRDELLLRAGGDRRRATVRRDREPPPRSADLPRVL